MEEIWKPIKGYEELYHVSNKGNVKSFDKIEIFYNSKKKINIHRFRKGRILLKRVRRGYNTLALYKDTKGKYFKVSRLVTSAFLENTKNKPYVNHKDGNKLNDVLENLEWCTPSENAIHAFATGLSVSKKGENTSMSKLTEESVLEIRNKYIPFEYSVYKLAKEYGVGKTTIEAIVTKRSWKHI